MIGRTGRSPFGPPAEMAFSAISGVCQGIIGWHLALFMDSLGRNRLLNGLLSPQGLGAAHDRPTRLITLRAASETDRFGQFRGLPGVY